MSTSAVPVSKSEHPRSQRHLKPNYTHTLEGVYIHWIYRKEKKKVAGKEEYLQTNYFILFLLLLYIFAYSAVGSHVNRSVH